MTDESFQPAEYDRLRRLAKAAFARDFVEIARRDHWDLALMLVGFCHLLVFLSCQYLYAHGDRAKTHFTALWGLELVAVLMIFRLVSGRGWHRSTPLAGIVVRVWATFLILSFNVATLNTLTGWTLDWFKPVWATLSTFVFATLAWLITPRFLILAVQMYFTGLIMVRFPAWNYLLYGLSWFVALQAISFDLRRNRPSHEMHGFVNSRNP
ncbi:MAG: hypothetical protein NVSMB14_02270 [Isosphaeraceae bacterium]